MRDIERLVLSGTAEELKDPRLIWTYVRNYNSERERLREMRPLCARG